MKSAAGTASAHGVLQVCPADVFTSAPAGSDSNCSGTVGVAVFINSPEEEHAASANPHAANANNLYMGRFRSFARMFAATPVLANHTSGPLRAQHA